MRTIYSIKTRFFFPLSLWLKTLLIWFFLTLSVNYMILSLCKVSYETLVCLILGPYFPSFLSLTKVVKMVGLEIQCKITITQMLKEIQFFLFTIHISLVYPPFSVKTWKFKVCFAQIIFLSQRWINKVISLFKLLQDEYLKSLKLKSLQVTENSRFLFICVIFHPAKLLENVSKFVSFFLITIA